MNKDLTRNKSRTRLEQREADILQAATRLFAADGFHATSTRKIAAAAGVSEGTVFHYFSTKNALLLAILDDFYADLAAAYRHLLEVRKHLELQPMAVDRRKWRQLQLLDGDK